jgi:MutS domain V
VRSAASPVPTSAAGPAGGNAASSGPEAAYRARREAFAAEERRHARRSFQLSMARLAAFLLGAACLFMILLEARAPRPLWSAGAGLALVLFVVLLVLHDRVIRRERRARDLGEINAEGLARIARDWPSLPVPVQPPLPGTTEAGQLPPLARDLGLFGRISLFHLLGTVHTPPGKTALASWLLTPAPPEEVAARQGAVAELAPDLDTRQELEQRVRRMEKIPPDPEIFLRWAEEPAWLLPRRGLIWAARLLALVALALLAGALARVLPLWPVLLAVTVNLILTHRFGERLESTYNRVTAREEEFQLYARALELISSGRYRSERLEAVVQALATGGRPAHAWMDLLHRRIVLSDTRRTVFHFLFQSLLLWDFHMVWLLERWKAGAGTRARAWLGALGDFEALAALAALSHAEPGWAFPRVDRDAPPLYEARDLAHPLLSAAVRVGNDVAVGPPGTFLLVTGSNMSGKSTLLRSIGANAVLAQAGGPVCAAALTLPPVALATSILVEDSLADGVSFFLAELHRIRTVVEAADRAAAEGRTLLYLLDEVLRGTNSYERQVAVRRVLLHLLAKGALGAVSTHDLQLAEVEDLRATCEPVHFQESYLAGPEGPRMTFDYKLRPGVATTTNALKLLELVGLGEPTGA